MTNQTTKKPKKMTKKEKTLLLIADNSLTIGAAVDVQNTLMCIQIAETKGMAEVSEKLWEYLYTKVLVAIEHSKKTFENIGI